MYDTEAQFIEHEDDRRHLIEWISDIPIRSAKYIRVKIDSIIGDHYHEKQDEIFFLAEGFAKRVVVGDMEEIDVAAPRKWIAKKGEHHLFELKAGSLLLAAGTTPFDASDELKK